jgi:hypothetical protein
MDASSSTTTPETLDDIILVHNIKNPISSSIVALNQNLHHDVYVNLLSRPVSSHQPNSITQPFYLLEESSMHV